MFLLCQYVLSLAATLLGLVFLHAFVWNKFVQAIHFKMGWKVLNK